MPMPRRFVVVSAVGLADCVGRGGPLYNHVLAMSLYLILWCWRVGGVFGGGIIVYLDTPISVSSVTGGGRFGTTVRTRAQGLDDEWNEGR